MYLDKPFSIALFISVLVHTLFFLPFTHFKNIAHKKELLTFAVTYLEYQQSPPQELLPKQTTIRVVEQPKVEQEQKTSKPKAKSEKPAEQQPKKKAEAIKTDRAQEKVEIPPELPKEEKAIYLDYYQSIREKIRIFVKNNYPRHIVCGEVCLFFMLSSDGTLKEIKVIAQRSSPNQILRNVAKRSVIQAAPFLPFPGGLSRPVLSFNVIISFELEN